MAKSSGNSNYSVKATLSLQYKGFTKGIEQAQKSINDFKKKMTSATSSMADSLEKSSNKTTRFAGKFSQSMDSLQKALTKSTDSVKVMRDATGEISGRGFKELASAASDAGENTRKLGRNAKDSMNGVSDKAENVGGKLRQTFGRSYDTRINAETGEAQTKSEHLENLINRIPEQKALHFNLNIKDHATSAIGKMQSALKHVGSEAKAARTSMADIAKGAAIGQGAMNMISNAASSVYSGFKNAVTQGMALNDTTNKIEATFKNMGFSKRQIAELNTQMAYLHRTMGLTGEQVSGLQRQMNGWSVIGFQGAQKLTTAVAAIGAGSRLSAEDTARLGQQLMRVGSSGTVTAGTLARILRTAPGLYRILARGAGMSVEKLRETISTGKVTQKQFQEWMANSSKYASDVFKDYGHTIVGVRARITAGWQDIEKQITKPLLSVRGTGAEQLADLLQSKAVQQGAEMLGDAIRSIAEWAMNLLAFLSEHRRVIVGIGEDVVQIANTLGSDVWQVFSTIAGDIARALGLVQKNAKPGDNLKQFQQALQKIDDFFKALSGDSKAASQNFGTFGNAIVRTIRGIDWGAINKDASSVFGDLVKIARTAGNNISKTFSSVLGSVGGSSIFNKIAAGLTRAANSVTRIIDRLINIVGRGFRKIARQINWGAVLRDAEHVFGTLTSLFGKVVGDIVKIFGTINHRISWNRILAGAMRAFDRVAKFAGQLADTVTKTLTRLIRSIHWDKLWKEFKSSFNSMKPVLKDISRLITTLIRDVVKFTSAFIKTGAIKSVLTAIKASIRAVASAMTALFGGSKKSSNFWKSFGRVAGNTMKAIAKAITNIANMINSLSKHHPNVLKGLVFSAVGLRGVAKTVSELAKLHRIVSLMHNVSNLNDFIKGLDGLSKTSKAAGAVESLTKKYRDAKDVIGLFGKSQKTAASAVKASIHPGMLSANAMYRYAQGTKDLGKAVDGSAGKLATLHGAVGKLTADSTKGVSAMEMYAKAHAHAAQQVAHLGNTDAEVVKHIGSSSSLLSKYNEIARRGFQALIHPIQTVKTLFAALKMTIVTQPYLALAVAIAAVVTALVMFFTKTKTGRRMWRNFTKALTKGWRSFTKAISAGWRGFTRGLSKVVSWVRRNWKEVGLYLVSPVAGAFNSLYKHNAKFRHAVNSLIKHIKNAWHGLISFFKNLWHNISSGTGKAWKTIRHAITAIVKPIQRAWHGVIAFFKKLWKHISDDVKGSWHTITSTIGKFVHNIKKIFKDLGDPKLLWNAGVKIIQGLWDGLQHAWKTVAKWIGSIAGWIKDHKGPLDYDAQLLVPAGHAIIGGLNKGLQDKFGDVKNTIASVNGVLKGIASPTLDTTSLSASLQGLDSQMQTSLDANINTRLVPAAQPAYINLGIGQHSYGTFVGDISRRQDQVNELEEARRW